MSMLTEFRDFALKGNVIDLAVGVIIGGAFGKIVDSMVKDIPRACPIPTRPTPRLAWPFWPTATSSPSS